METLTLIDSVESSATPKGSTFLNLPDDRSDPQVQSHAKDLERHDTTVPWLAPTTTSHVQIVRQATGPFIVMPRSEAFYSVLLKTASLLMSLLRTPRTICWLVRGRAMLWAF